MEYISGGPGGGSGSFGRGGFAGPPVLAPPNTASVRLARCMPETTSVPLSAALINAVHVGLRLTSPHESLPWSRLSCPVCGGALDLPFRSGPGMTFEGVVAEVGREGAGTLGDRDGDSLAGLTPMRAARRVDAFAHRHQEGWLHR